MKRRGDEFRPGELRRLMRPIYRKPVKIYDAKGCLIAVVTTDPVTGKTTRRSLPQQQQNEKDNKP